MREERNVLNSDVEIPEVVLKKRMMRWHRSEKATKPVRKAKKEVRFQGGFRYAQAAAIACASTGWSGWDYRYSSSCSPFMESGHAGQYTGNRRTAERPGRAGNGDQKVQIYRSWK